jgi:hypothetical protein
VRSPWGYLDYPTWRLRQPHGTPLSERLITVAEASGEFWVPEKTIRTWIERGLLSWHTPGLLLEADVAEVERQTRQLPRMRRLLA